MKPFQGIRNVLRAGNWFVRRDHLKDACGEVSFFERAVHEFVQSCEQVRNIFMVGNPSSCVYSSVDTMVNGPTVKVLGWYDNEWGYSNRLIDLVGFIGAQ